VDCQQRVAQAFVDREAWTRASILNVARIGRFSSDRAIAEYAERIWSVKPDREVARAHAAKVETRG